MRFPRPRRASFESLVVVEEVSASGATYVFETEASFAARSSSPNPRPPGAYLKIGVVRGGRVVADDGTSRDLRTFVPIVD